MIACTHDQYTEWFVRKATSSEPPALSCTIGTRTFSNIHPTAAAYNIEIVESVLVWVVMLAILFLVVLPWGDTDKGAHHAEVPRPSEVR